MVSLTISGCCNGCPYIELNLQHYFGDALKYYELHCEHASVCSRLEKESLMQSLKQRLTPEDLRPPMETREG